MSNDSIPLRIVIEWTPLAKRHNNPNSLVNRKINEDPAEYKFVCTLHEGRCKKYFKTEKVQRGRSSSYALESE